MKAKVRIKQTAALAAALCVGAAGLAFAQESDTNATTVAYWKLGAVDSVPLSPSGNGILDLATNAGQGTIPGTVSGVPVSVQDLWFQGPVGGGQTYVTDVPPASLFNGNSYFNSGTGSWDCGADLYSGLGGSLTCDNTTYGNNFNGPDFTWEVYFKSDTVNDPILGTQTQFLIFDHHQSAYAFLSLNDNPGDTNNIGSLRFWSYNVAVFGIDCRITAAQNHGHRLDDGQWHYAAARFKSSTETMDLLVINEDGTSAETSTYVTETLNPGGSGSQGPVFLGTDENQNEQFDGLINQLRYSDASLPASQLLANASSCNTPVFNNIAATNTIAVGDLLSLSPAFWPVQVLGGPLQLQWTLNGANLPGQTNLVINLFPAAASAAGVYQLVATTPCGGLAVTSAPTLVNIVPKIPVNIARWRMESVANVTNNGTPPGTFVGIMDSDVAVGQGVLSTGAGNVIPSEDDLITFNSSASNPGGITFTNDVAPTTMFVDGNNAGTNSFYAAWIDNTVGGALFFPQDQYGDELDFRTSFSLELFFKTIGDQSGAGPMQLLAQGPDGGNFTYGLNVNQAANGAVSFKINNHAIAPAGPGYEDTNAGVQSVVLSNQNYADGTWHYLLAKYDSTGNSISLAIANADGTGASATAALPAGYSPLAAGDFGNMFIGRYRFGAAPGDDPRTFVGMIDEVQVSSGLVTPSTGQLGYIPGPPVITSISLSGNTVTIQFTGSPAAAASSYTLVGSPAVNGTYSALAANVTSLGGGNFQATVAKSGVAEFYKIKH